MQTTPSAWLRSAGPAISRKTPRDLKEIARNNRIARKHQDFLERQREKQPGRRLPSRAQWRELERFVGERLGIDPPPGRSSEDTGNGD